MWTSPSARAKETTVQRGLMSSLHPKYHVDLNALPGHSIPPLLSRFGAWLSSQEYGSLGWFSLRTENVATAWYPGGSPDIQENAFSFLHLPDGSSLLLVNRDEESPSAVALSGSEGETDSVATSLEEFLMLLRKGETGVAELLIRPRMYPTRSTSSQKNTAWSYYSATT